MSDKTHIQWTAGDDGTAGATWNPVTGCTKISEGCTRCYIERTPPFRMQHRKFDKPGIGGTTGVLLHPERLWQPAKWRVPRRVFVNSLSDLFHDDVPDEFIGSVFDVMAQTPQHTYQILTKRPARMRALLTRWQQQADGRPHAAASFRRFDLMWCEPPVWPLPNVWVGVSAESQKWADIRIPLLMRTPAAIRFVSAEPLLGPLNVARYVFDEPSGLPGDWTRGLDWLIAGGESGPGARPMDPAWAASLVKQCQDVGTAVFVKQLGTVWAKENGAADRKGGDIDEWPADLRVRQFPPDVAAVTA